MFQFTVEAGERAITQEAEPDYQLMNLQLKITNLGAVFKGSKRLYHWTFDARRPRDTSSDWEFVSVMLTDSSYSKKKTLAVNSNKVIDQEKM